MNTSNTNINVLSSEVYENSSAKQQQAGISEMAFDSENKLDALNDFRGSRGSAKRRMAPLCISLVLNGLHFELPLFMINLLRGMAYPFVLSSGEEGRSALKALL